MAGQYAILGVEGPHDQAFVSKILQLMGFREFKGKKSKLNPFWFQFIPTYPKKQLYVRVDMPSILFTDDLSVAVYAGEGTNLKSRFPVLLRNHPPYHQDISAFGIIADADDKEPRGLFRNITKHLKSCFLISRRNRELHRPVL
ncbi:hypothetical protein QUF72_10680 [Desulfobacterales bacterium HSG2]|nr:hypothetical protein [Desulfobacterales bacterium HSG2]